jgi:hypothetical protein
LVLLIASFSADLEHQDLDAEDLDVEGWVLAEYDHVFDLIAEEKASQRGRDARRLQNLRSLGFEAELGPDGITVH